MNKIILIISLAIIGLGCAVSHNAVREDQGTINAKAADLKAALVSLEKTIDEKEAALAAEAAVFYPLKLSDEYKLVRPPVLHNLLVNMGMKERGLCIHWTEDLLNRLKDLKLRSFDLYWGVAEAQSLLGLQHSSVVITAKSRPFEEGIVLDAWRNSGELFWIRVKDDSYQWKPEQDVFHENRTD
jgi:hypothetical protein